MRSNSPMPAEISPLSPAGRRSRSQVSGVRSSGNSVLPRVSAADSVACQRRNKRSRPIALLRSLRLSRRSWSFALFALEALPAMAKCHCGDGSNCTPNRPRAQTRSKASSVRGIPSTLSARSRPSPNHDHAGATSVSAAAVFCISASATSAILITSVVFIRPHARSLTSARDNSTALWKRSAGLRAMQRRISSSSGLGISAQCADGLIGSDCICAM